MKKVLTLAGAVSALAFTTAYGQSVEINADMAKKLRLSKIVSCAVAGSPSEFPDDIKIINSGLGTLSAGTKVQWQVPFAGKQGVYTLASALNPGKAVLVSGVLPGGVEAGHDCKAKFI